MRFTTASILALSTVVAALPTDTASYGAWNVTVTIDSAANGYKSREVLATYANDNSNSTITAHCAYTYLPGNPPQETDTCDDDTFSYELSSGRDSIALTQTVPIGKDEVKVIGDSPITLSCNSATGRYCTGQAIVQAAKA